MLRSLYISSFIIIDKMQIEFDEGMSVLTGETGAGKSIIVDALSQLCGARASVSLIKKNCSKAMIEGVFDISINDELEELCEQLHIDIDDQFVVSKEIFQSGKSIIKINYQNASNSALKLLSPYFMDIHSQFETQRLFNEKNHIDMLDEYAKNNLEIYLQDYRQLYKHYKSLTQQLNQAIEEDMSDEQLDYLLSQAHEIDEIIYTDEEIDELSEELKLLQDHEKINQVISEFDQYMSNGISNFNDALHSLNRLTHYEDFAQTYESLYDMYYNVRDQYEEIMDIYHDYQFDEYRFNELQDVLYKVNRLKRKYGFTMVAINEYRQDLENQIERIKHRDEYITSLKKQIKETYDNALNIAKQIHTIRQQKALQFEQEIQDILKDLYLENAQFKVEFLETDLSNKGNDRVSFMVSINKGQNLSLLNESASGGEISRIMLAIKMVILQYENVDTIIFDEVDSGVSGKIATSIGEKMHNLAKQKQVICITHLPQVASLADNHYSIEKTMGESESISSIKRLNKEERIYEIAKMLSGEHVTHEAIENAKKLLNV